MTRNVGEFRAMSNSANGVTATVIDRLVDNLAAGKGVVLRTLAAATSVPGSEWFGVVSLTDGTNTIYFHGFQRGWGFHSLGYEIIIPPGWTLQCRGDQFTGTGNFLCQATWDDVI